MMDSDNVRTISPSAVSLPAVVPVYTIEVTRVYPLVASAIAHTVKPRFTGLRGKYCFIDERPLNGIIALSILISVWVVHR